MNNQKISLISSVYTTAAPTVAKAVPKSTSDGIISSDTVKAAAIPFAMAALPAVAALPAAAVVVALPVVTAGYAIVKVWDFFMGQESRPKQAAACLPHRVVGKVLLSAIG